MARVTQSGKGPSADDNARARDGGPKLGAKVRGHRRTKNLSQVELAERLGISASYLNLIENNRRPLPAPLLIKLAQIFDLDLHAFAADEDARLVSDLTEAFADPLFEDEDLTSVDVREMATASPQASRAVLSLYKAYQAARETADNLSSKLAGGEDLGVVDRSHIPTEEVSDFIQKMSNFVPELEAGAEALWREAELGTEDLYQGLLRYLERAHGVTVQIARSSAGRGILRRFDASRGELVLSELLPTRTRTFQVAHQVGLLTQRAVIDRLVSDGRLTTPESRALARVSLANYFAGAVLMPYDAFMSACREERYDLDVIGRRFKVGFEQVCHRVTTLRRPGNEGVPFHMVRIDVAGNISKRFSASGIRFARFSGACPRWNIFSAFLTPGMIRIQMSRMPDGVAYFCLARTIQKDSGGYHAQKPVQAIGLGCQAQYAKELVYSDGIDLSNPDTCIPVGVTCRMCERTDCEQRAFPSLKHPLTVLEDVRGVSLYAPVSEGRRG